MRRERNRCVSYTHACTHTHTHTHTQGNAKQKAMDAARANTINLLVMEYARTSGVCCWSKADRVIKTLPIFSKPTKVQCH